MLLSLLRPFGSEGEKAIFTSLVSAAVIGAWIAYVVEHRLAGAQGLLEFPSLYDIWIMLAGGCSAIIALLLGKHWFGQPGPIGVAKTVFGIVAVTFAAALIGGTIALPIYGTMFGPLALVGTFVDQPALLMIWLAVLCAANVAFGIHRRERDSIFNEVR